MPLSAINKPHATTRGIDLSKHHGEIRKIVAAHFSSSCTAAGIELDDLVQETMFKCHRLNRSPRSAYDPALAGFAHYVWIMADRLLKTMVQVRARHPLSDLDVPESVDPRTDPEEHLLVREAAAVAAQDAIDESDDEDDDQILIAATLGPVHSDLGAAVASIQARQVEPRTRRRAAPPAGHPRVQMAFGDDLTLGDELVGAFLASRAAVNDTMGLAS